MLNCIFFNSFSEGAEESGQRLSIMETIRLFLQLVNPNLLQVHFDSLYKTISEQSNDKIDDLIKISNDNINILKISTKQLKHQRSC